MSIDEISENAKMTAHRVLDGKDVSEGEMRFVTAGLLISVDKLSNTIIRLEGSLWSEDKLKAMMIEVADKHCKEVMFRCQQAHDMATGQDAAKKSATWVGRALRALIGG